MGVITIEVPQRVKRSYRIESEDSAKDVMKRLEKVAKKSKLVDLTSVFGIWSDRTESAEEISAELRKKSNSRVKNGKVPA